VFQTEQINIATAVINCKELHAQSNKKRTQLLQKIIEASTGADIILLPAGYYDNRRMTKRSLRSLAKNVIRILKRTGASSIVCVGVDYQGGKHQLAYAVNAKGIVAAGRKFYPTKDERGVITTATDFLSMENGMERMFQVKGFNCYMAVCYDGFGVRHLNTENPGVDIFLNLVHCFYEKGQGNSGDVYFARKGFAGVSMHWGCTVFGAAVFFGREMSERWLTGVLYSGSKSVQTFKYADNEMTWTERVEVAEGVETAIIHRYTVTR